MKEAAKKYRAKVKRVYLDFYPTEADLFAHVEKQPRKQTYIKDLIRKDMTAQGQWESNENYFVDTCSICGFAISWAEAELLDLTLADFKHCPGCGAPMCVNKDA